MPIAANDAAVFSSRATPSSEFPRAICTIDAINALIAGGSLAQNKAGTLINKLDQVVAKLDGGQTGAACNQLGSFINQVNAFISNGSLTQAQGQALIDAANAIRTDLGC